ncbi:DnaJ domain-containing protein [Methanobrevibacter sp.]|uniref:DnaJ domain-containing protein n=1 Tax=Methanobrevibacter sp. TaxID=66852 RepID=UPI00386F80E1
MQALTIDEYIKILGLKADFKKLQKEQQKQEVTKAFKKFALLHHPDLHKGDTKCEEIFKSGNEAREKILEYIENGSLRAEKEYSSKQSSSNTNDDFEQAVKDIFKDFEETEKRKREEENRKTKEILFKILGLLLLIALTLTAICGLPLALLIGANFLLGKIKTT